MMTKGSFIRKTTKQERKRDRQEAGDLMDLLLTKQRAARNRKAATLFLAWARRNKYPLNSCSRTLTTAVVAFILACWHDGESKEVVSSLLQSFKYLMPQNVPVLSLPWRLYRKWAQKELPTQAPAAHRTEAMALAGRAFRQKHWGLGVMILVSFDGFLRTGEFICAVPRQFIENQNTMVMELGETKGVQRRGGSEMYVCRDRHLVGLLRTALKKTTAGQPVIGMSAAQFRAWFKRTTQDLGLQSRGLLPYSLRRGGITAAVSQGTPASTVVLRARWHNARVAEVYVREGQQALASLKWNPTTLRLLSEAISYIPRS
jgi:hypothetical protein